jgi:hypothetical protein
LWEIRGYTRIDRLVWLKIEGDFLFLAFVGEDSPDEQHEAVGWYSVV